MTKFYTLIGDPPVPDKFYRLADATFSQWDGRRWTKVTDIRLRNYLYDRLESGDGVLVPSTPAEIARLE